VLPKDSVVPLRLVKDLLADLGVEVLEECKDLPQRKRDALLLEDVLEEFGVYSLMQEKTRWLGFDQFLLFLFALLFLLTFFGLVVCLFKCRSKE
jgi:hypothetical protein